MDVQYETLLIIKFLFMVIKFVTVRRFTFDLHEGGGQTDVRTVDDVMAIKPNFLASMGYQYFLSYGATRAGARGAPLLVKLSKVLLENTCRFDKERFLS